MIFSENRAQQVIDDIKTATRRPVKPGEEMHHYQSRKGGLVHTIRSVSVRLPNGGIRLKWEEGRIYSVQPGRAKHGIGRIKLIAITQERLGDITEADAIAEGMKDREHFFQVWRELYGTVNHNELVWVLTFKAVR